MLTAVAVMLGLLMVWVTVPVVAETRAVCVVHKGEWVWIRDELVRHRMFSFSQESTRYVRYDEGLQVIMSRFENDAQQMQAIAWQNAECIEPYATEVNFESFLHAR